MDMEEDVIGFEERGIKGQIMLSRLIIRGNTFSVHRGCCVTLFDRQ